MSLSERSRAILYRRLTTIIEDEEAVGEMLTQLTAVEAEQVATKDFVRAEVGDLRAEMLKGFNRLLMWMVTLDMAMVGLLLGFLRKG
ncbi:MAG TPA: hypothetical protein VGO60_10195 [Iamia sp.]|jgi:hypothetical protein|nr:hypothetical protein [Iamia sp.]